MKKIIGVYNKSVILTYIGLTIEILGIMLTHLKKVDYGVICLMVAGICDGFDGTIARRIERTKREKNFGVQIDSLNDIIGSVILPITLMCAMEFTNWYNYIIYVAFALCGMIRLSYFNIITEENGDYFIGAPVTISNIILPIIYLLTKNQIVYMVTLVAISIAYILDVRIKKLDLKKKIIATIIGIIIILIIAINGGK